MADAVAAVLTAFRRTSLPLAGIPDTVPIRVCENGWPTGPGRGEQRQAAVLDTVVRTVAALAGELNIDGYSLFALRDADSHAEGLFPHFGLLHDDYTPKQAFRTYRDLIEELHVGDRPSGCGDWASSDCGGRVLENGRFGRSGGVGVAG
ncbi:hypothetical protein [Kitasatospora phosalacinea]|uniref:hypothetical protein n=1 Tax=Kitasatospora phosalacinea TaxID=2065 RepID=UPI00068E9E66|nr:hypothetical protein [Kitasatospora phosalacinea]